MDKYQRCFSALRLGNIVSLKLLPKDYITLTMLYRVVEVGTTVSNTPVYKLESESATDKRVRLLLADGYELIRRHSNKAITCDTYRKGSFIDYVQY